MLERFLQAQKDCYNRALEEIKTGKKRTHWMWYIFPQISGLGHSMNSIFFSIKNIEEAKEYLEHPLLKGRALPAVSLPVAEYGGEISQRAEGLVRRYEYDSRWRARRSLSTYLDSIG